jgi:hypothetical protein
MKKKSIPSPPLGKSAIAARKTSARALSVPFRPSRLNPAWLYLWSSNIAYLDGVPFFAHVLYFYKYLPFLSLFLLPLPLFHSHFFFLSSSSHSPYLLLLFVFPSLYLNAFCTSFTYCKLLAGTGATALPEYT